MAKYGYKGPVMEFGKCIANVWQGETTAVSESKARNNLIYQFKLMNNRSPVAAITLPGKIIAK